MSDSPFTALCSHVSNHRSELQHAVITHRNNTPSRTARKGGDDDSTGGVNGNGTGINC